MQFTKGMRDKLEKYFDLYQGIDVKMEISGQSEYDFCCFGVDKDNQLLDDSYMVFYNQVETPNKEITYTYVNKTGKFRVNLNSLPSDIYKLVFTVSIDGKGTMSEISSHIVTISQPNSENIIFELAGNNFLSEKALISIEIYRKDCWRIAAIGNGFNGGLSTLLNFFGGVEETQENKQSNTQQTIIANTSNDKNVKNKIEADNTASGATIAGTVYGNVSNASTIYGSDKFSTPRGHGFAAEQANHLYDKFANGDFLGQGKVQLVGEDIDPNTGRIIKNGADRIVNGTNIQTKYCKTGGKCISECFENGKFRYWNSDGSPMQVEVPSDKYDAAVQAMENRIKNGEVPGVTDPKEAKNIIRKGHFTYEQAKNIAKAGTVESITFDAVNGAIIATSAFGISTVLSFATSVWNGEDFDIAIKNATYTGLKVGGTTFITAVLASQLSKAGLNSALVSSSEAIVSIMGPRASAMLVNAFRSGSNIYGAAAMKSAAKMLRGNAITGAVSVVVLSSVDVVNIFRGRISGKQLFKNVANTASTVAGGTAGWVGGATAGAAIGSAVPIIGTAIGGLVGGLVGSFAAGAASGKVSNAVLGAFIEDDADEMVRIIEKVFQELASDYLLNQKEAENIVDALKDELTGGTLKDMFASSDRNEFANKLLIKNIEKEVNKRKKITMPSDEEMQKSLRKVLEEIADAEENLQPAY